NGAINCMTGERTGRSPKDKFLEDTPGIHDKIWWGTVNRPLKPAVFDTLLERSVAHLQSRPEVFEFRGFAGADPQYRLGVRVLTEKAWHSLFAQTLFIRPTDQELASFKGDWTVINACGMPLNDWRELGLNSHVAVVQSLERKIVIIAGTEYAGEMKKSIFFAINYDLPEVGVFPMHCSATAAKGNPDDVALTFGRSGTGKTTLSADPDRDLIGDDEHG